MEDVKKEDKILESYPVLPLRNTILFPNQIIPIYIGRKQSLDLISDISDLEKKYIVVVAQKDGAVENPKNDDIYEYGTLSTVMKIFDMPDKSKSAIVQGIMRVKLESITQNTPYFTGLVSRIKDENIDQDFFSAIKICKKKRIGPARIDDNRPLFYKKDISLLARNGFKKYINQ